MIGRARGLGQTTTQLPSLQQSGFFTVDCSQDLQWFANPVCWTNSPTVWQQMNAIYTAAGPIPEPSPPPAVAAGYTTVPPTVSQAQQQINAALAAGKAANTAALQSYFGGAATSIANIPASAVPTGAAAIPTVDCTNLWTALTNPSSCFSGTSMLVPGLLIGGAVLVAAMIFLRR